MKSSSNSTSQEEENNSYAFHLLANNNPETIARAQIKIKGGSAVLVYPADPKSLSEEQEYKACFIRKGTFVTAKKDKEIVLKEVSLGKQPLTNKMPQKQIDAVVNKALSLAGIIKNPFGFITQDLTRNSIFSYLTPKELDAVAKVSRQACDDARPTLQKRAVAKLLQHVIYGEKDAAEAMLKQASKLQDKTLLRALLSSEETVASYSFGLDRDNPVKVRGTALQIALMADDVDVVIEGVKVVDGIAEMILPYFKELPDGEAEITNQLQIDPAEEKKEEERSARDLEALEKVVKAIEAATDAEAEAALAHDAKEDNPAESALIEFRNALEPKEAITFGGKQFNPALLQRAWELYDEKFVAFDNDWNTPKNKLFRHKIIGYIDRFLSACTGQVFAFGDFYVIEMREKLIRGLEFRDDYAVIFPLDSDPRSRLGYDFMAHRCPDGLVLRQQGRRWRLQGEFASFFQTLCRAKTAGARILCSAQATRPRARV